LGLDFVQFSLEFLVFLGFFGVTATGKKRERQDKADNQEGQTIFEHLILGLSWEKQQWEYPAFWMPNLAEFLDFAKSNAGEPNT
jgi:hypothetical protein